MPMRLEELAQRIEADIVANALGARGIEIDRVFAADSISDMLNTASETALIVTNLTNTLPPRVARLLDVPAICFVDHVVPDGELICAAAQNDMVVLVSPVSMYETCRRLSRCLATDTH